MVTWRVGDVFWVSWLYLSDLVDQPSFGFYRRDFDRTGVAHSAGIGLEIWS